MVSFLVVNICIFGDSLTWGARLPFRVGWANLLRNYLERTSEDFYAVYDLGIDADSSKDLLKRFEVEAESRSPEIVIFAIGTNDSAYRKAKNDPETPVEVFEENLRTLVLKARKFTNKIIFVGLTKGEDSATTPLPVSFTGKCYDKENIKIYDSIIKKVAKSEGLHFADVNTKLNDEDFDDGLHPNILGHDKIFKAVKELLVGLLEVQDVEPLILVNRLDKIIGYKYRNELNSGDIVRVSALWVRNLKGNILIARRSLSKRRDPGKWGPAAARILEKGDSYKSAVAKAAKDKIDFKNFATVSLKKVFVTGKNMFFCKWFGTEINPLVESLKLNSKEALEIRWVTKNDLIRETKNNPAKFVQSFNEYMKFLD